MMLAWGCLSFAISAGLTLGANWVALRPWRRTVDVHWTERARLLYPVLVASAGYQLWMPVVVFLYAFGVFGLSAWLAGWCALGAFAGALAGTYPMTRERFPFMTGRDWLRLNVTGWSLRLGWLGVLVAAALIMPDEPGWPMAGVAVAYLTFHLFWQAGLATRVLRMVGGLKEGSERLCRIVDEVAGRMRVPVRACYLFGGPNAAAFAMPITREVLFSERLMEICPDDEVASIAAHELGHLAESKAVVAGRILGSLSLFPLVFIQWSIARFGIGGLVGPGLAVAGIAIFARRLARRMETVADAAAARVECEEGVYARALERLYRDNQLPAVNATNRGTHSHLYDRLIQAGVVPDYPRPEPPAANTMLGTLLPLSLLAVGGFLWILRQL